MKSRQHRSAKDQVRQTLPTHWTPEQALAVFEAVEFLRDSLWVRYGMDIQRAWREQLLCGQQGCEPEIGEPF